MMPAVLHLRRRHIAAQAFTLIELLVVVAIIALLVSILLPSLVRAREQTRSVACSTNMRQIALGMATYEFDFRRLPPTESSLKASGKSAQVGMTWQGRRSGINLNSDPNPACRKDDFTMNVPTKGVIFKHVRDPKVYVCPGDRPGLATDTITGGGGNGRISYSMNAYIGEKTLETLSAFTWVQDYTATSDIRDPRTGDAIPADRAKIGAGMRVVWPTAKTLLLVEEHPYWKINSVTTNPSGWSANAGYGDGNFNSGDRIVTRHFAGTGGNAAKGRSNMAYLDGHVDGRLLIWTTSAQWLYFEARQPFLDGDPNMTAFMKRR